MKRRQEHRGHFISGQRGREKDVYRGNTTAGLCVYVFGCRCVCDPSFSHACSLSQRLHRLTYFLFIPLFSHLLSCKPWAGVSSPRCRLQSWHESSGLDDLFIAYSRCVSHNRFCLVNNGSATRPRGPQVEKTSFNAPHPATWLDAWEIF